MHSGNPEIPILRIYSKVARAPDRMVPHVRVGTLDIGIRMSIEHGQIGFELPVRRFHPSTLIARPQCYVLSPHTAKFSTS